MNRINMTIERRNLSEWIIKFTVLGLLVYFPVFLHLDALPIRIWDESRLAINAYEMHKNGNFIVTYFDGLPDMWNTKPPLLIWLQVICIKIFGVSELAIRFLSAVAAFLTVLSLVIFAVRYIKDFWFGFITAMILVTSYGYINVHVTRTGDYDSMLILFTTLYPLLFLAFLETGNRKFLHLFFAAIALAVLTKSIEGLMLVPAVVIFFLLNGRYSLLKDKWLYIDAFICLTSIAGYYLLREAVNPGYLLAVWNNELGGRYLTTIENHTQSFWFYYEMLINRHYANWYWLLLPGVVIGFFMKSKRIKQLTILSALIVVSYWYIISTAGTKLEWYEAPLFPFMAILSAVPVYELFIWMKTSQDVSRLFRYNIVPFILLFVCFLTPYREMINKVYFPQEYEWEKDRYRISHFMQLVARSGNEPSAQNLCYAGYSPQLKFYINILNDAGVPMVFRDWTRLGNGEKIVASQPQIQEYIESNYAVNIVGNFDGIKHYVVKERR